MNASRQGFIYTDTTMEKSDESRTSRSPTKRVLAAETIEKQLRENDVSHKKEKALLSQKIEFLSLQLKDSQEREENARKIHDTMISAFKQDNSESAQLEPLVKEYEEKITYLKSKNHQLEDTLTQFAKSDLQPSPSCDQPVSLDKYMLKSEHLLALQSLSTSHAQQMQKLSDRHQQEKAILLERLESKQTFTFGEKSKKLFESEVSSNSSVRDEIERLSFLVEEKEYMNAELKSEIIILRERIASASHEHCNKEIMSLAKENERILKDLNRTEQNYNEQCVLYKQKLDEERRRSKEIRDEFREMKEEFDLKFCKLKRDLRDKEDEIKDLKDRTCKISEDSATDSVVIHEGRDGNWNGLKKNRESYGNDEIANAWKEEVDRYLMENANRIECRRCFNLLNPSSFYGHFKNDGTCSMQNSKICGSPIIKRSISPNCKSILGIQSQDFSINFPPSIDYSANTAKNECAYGNMSNICRFSHNNAFHKMASSNISTTFDDKNIDIRCSQSNNKFRNISHSLQNSAQKERSINDRLDTTEYLLKKLNKKFNNIIKEGPKINLQIGEKQDTDLSSVASKQTDSKWLEHLSKIKRKIKMKCTSNCGELTPNQKDNRASNSKMKQLISKIMINKTERKDRIDTAVSSQSESISDGSSIIRAVDSNHGYINSSCSRYDKIEEEPSNINSESIISSEFIENSNKMTSKECDSIVLESISDRDHSKFRNSKANEATNYREVSRESKLNPNNNQSNYEGSNRRESLRSSSSSLMFNDQINKRANKINSAKKGSHKSNKEIKEYFEQQENSKLQSYREKGLNAADSIPKMNIFSLHDKNIYKDIECRNLEPKSLTTRKSYQNNLRRKASNMPKSKKMSSSKKNLNENRTSYLI